MENVILKHNSGVTKCFNVLPYIQPSLYAYSDNGMLYNSHLFSLFSLQSSQQVSMYTVFHTNDSTRKVFPFRSLKKILNNERLFYAFLPLDQEQLCILLLQLIF